MRRTGMGLLMAGLALTLAACAGDVQGVLAPVAHGAPGASKVTMLVATTRSRDPDSGILFSGERGMKPAFAEITVSIPPENVRKVGEVQWPSSLPGDPARDFVTLKVDELEQPAALARLHAAALKAPKRRVLVFIHGFNNRFEDAVYRFAQIVHDSDASVVPVLFTWPSRGSLFAYGYDRESTDYSRHALEAMLQALARDPAIGEISILAHSMGNWLTLESLRQMAIRNGQIAPKIANIMLASPDVDVDVFRTQIAEIGKTRSKFTLFVSRDDRALAVSRRVWGSKARLGAIDPEAEPYHDELAADGFTVLDLTKLRSADRLNHDKFAESPEVVRLIGTRLVAGQPITDSRVGLGDRLMQVTSSGAATIGTAVGLAISAPIAIVDPHTRRNLSGQAEELGRSIDATTRSTSQALTAPLESIAPHTQ